MRVVIELDGKHNLTQGLSSKDGLSESLHAQFLQLQKELMELKRKKKSSESESITSALSRQQDALESALNRIVSNIPKTRHPKQNVNVRMPDEFMNRMDSLEEAVLASSNKTRNRTFGSNY